MKRAILLGLFEAFAFIGLVYVMTDIAKWCGTKIPQPKKEETNAKG